MKISSTYLTKLITLLALSLTLFTGCQDTFSPTQGQGKTDNSQQTTSVKRIPKEYQLEGTYKVTLEKSYGYKTQYISDFGEHYFTFTTEEQFLAEPDNDEERIYGIFKYENSDKTITKSGYYMQEPTTVDNEWDEEGHPVFVDSFRWSLYEDDIRRSIRYDYKSSSSSKYLDDRKYLFTIPDKIDRLRKLFDPPYNVSMFPNKKIIEFKERYNFLELRGPGSTYYLNLEKVN